MTPFDVLRPRLLAEPKPPSRDFLETAVSVILAPGPSGLEALFIRRAERAGDPWSGHIGLPGGRREGADAGLLDTAIRETLEEIGVKLTRASLLGALDDLEPTMPTKPPLLIRPFVFGLDARPVIGTSDEVTDSYWIPLESLHAARGKATVSIKEKALEVPCFRVANLPEGLVIWGLTYRIIGGLLPRL